MRNIKSEYINPQGEVHFGDYTVTGGLNKLEYFTALAMQSLLMAGNGYGETYIAVNSLKVAKRVLEELETEQLVT